MSRTGRPRASTTKNICERLKIPEAFWPLISESWHRDDASLYGRLDLSFDGRGPAKLLEYNADTPTSIFEAAVFQWTWLEQAIERQIIPKRADQFNSIHERLIEAWKKLGAGRHLHLAGMTENVEDAGTLAYLEDTARQAGLTTTLIDIEDIGLRDDGRFVDLDDRADRTRVQALSLGMDVSRRVRRQQLAKAPTRWIEPPWKAILSNKGMLPLLWEMFPGHPNLLPAFFEDDPERRAARHVLCAQAALFARRRQCRADQRAASPWWSSKVLMAAKDLFARRWRRCQIFRISTPCSAAG